MSLVQISGNASGTGTLTVAAPSTNTNRTLTLPDNTGTLLSTGSTFAGTGPAFSAYPNTNHAITNGGYAQIQNNTEEFDTASRYNNTGATVGGIPAYSFLPNVEGYYQVSAAAYPFTSTTATNISIYKNGTTFKTTSNLASTSSCSISTLIYFNGSTDYISAYVYVSGATPLITGLATLTFFQAAFVRAA